MHSNVRHGKTAENKKLKKVLTYPKSSSILNLSERWDIKTERKLSRRKNHVYKECRTEKCHVYDG
jgi:hypothetical protein